MTKLTIEEITGDIAIICFASIAATIIRTDREAIALLIMWSIFWGTRIIVLYKTMVKEAEEILIVDTTLLENKEV